MKKRYKHIVLLLVGSLLLGGCDWFGHHHRQDSGMSQPIEQNITQETTRPEDNVTTTPQSVDTNETQTEDNNNSYDDNETQTIPTNEVDTTQQEITQPEDNTTTTPQSVDTNETQTEDNTTTSDTNTTDTNDTSVTEGNDENTTQQTNTEIKALKLTIQKSTLNKDTNTTLKVEALYKNNTKEDVTTKVEWIIKPNDAIEIKGDTLIAKKDTNVTLQAKLDNKTSNPITLHIYWKVNNHTLPPEPDPKVNNATLLGVDVNDNGVRDDVERWIYNKYKDKHPIHIDIAMQAGRAYNQLLKSPLENSTQAKAIHKKCIAPIACEAYYQIYAKYFNEPLLVTEEINIGYFQKFYFNTPRRKELYNKYSRLLSGGMYSTPKIGEGKNLCDFNVSVYKD